jgi:hypothetical protein
MKSVMNSVLSIPTRLYRNFNLRRFLLTSLIVEALLLMVGCGTTWVTEASAIVTAIGLAIPAALEVLAAFGIGLPTAVSAQIAAWAQTAQSGLTEITNLIAQYNTAEASAQPGILSQIQTIVQTITGGLSVILPLIKITNAATQAKIVAVFDAILSELAGLANLIPALQTAAGMEDHTEALAMVANSARELKVKSAKNFVSDFNHKIAALNAKFQIKMPASVA